MSGIFRKKATTSDYDAFTRFVRGSKTTILSDSSNHALVLKITWRGAIEDHVKVTSVPSTGTVLSTAGRTASGAKRSYAGERAAAPTVSSSMLVGSPYARIWYDPGTKDIVIDDVRELVLKLVPIDLTDESTKRFGSLEEKSIMIKGIDTPKYISSPIVWWNEVIVQRLAFYSTFMIDFQMQAVTPNVIIAFFVNQLKITDFYSLFSLNAGETRLDNFFQAAFENSNIRIGCMLMEYMTGARDFEDFKCFFPEGNSGTFEEMKECMEAKSHGLIQIDKLHYAGILHKDLHLRNAMKYTNPSGRICGCVIDFGKSTIVTDRDECQTRRVRNFNDLDKSTADPIYKLYKSHDSDTHYIKNCIVKPESNPHKVQSGVTNKMDTRDYFKAWNSFTLFTNPFIHYGKYTIIQRGTCQYIDYQRMNEIDAEMVKDGKDIRDILYSELEVKDDRYYIAQDTQNEGKYSRSLKNGGNSMLHAYLEKKGLSENCDAMLQNNDPFCITEFDPNSEISICQNSACSSSSASSSTASSSTCERVLRTKTVTELGKAMQRMAISPICGDSSVTTSAATSSSSAAGGGGSFTSLAATNLPMVAASGGPLTSSATANLSMVAAGGGGLGTTPASSSSAASGFVAEGKTSSRKNRSRKYKARRTTFRKTRRNNRSRI